MFGIRFMLRIVYHSCSKNHPFANHNSCWFTKGGCGSETSSPLKLLQVRSCYPVIRKYINNSPTDHRKYKGSPTYHKRNKSNLVQYRKQAGILFSNQQIKKNMTPKAHFRFQKALIPKTDSWKP